MKIQVTRFGNFSCWFETECTRMDKKNYKMFKNTQIVDFFFKIPFKLAQNLVLQCLYSADKGNNNQLKHMAFG